MNRFKDRRIYRFSRKSGGEQNKIKKRVKHSEFAVQNIRLCCFTRHQANQQQRQYLHKRVVAKATTRAQLIGRDKLIKGAADPDFLDVVSEGDDVAEVVMTGAAVTVATSVLVDRVDVPVELEMILPEVELGVTKLAFTDWGLRNVARGSYLPFSDASLGYCVDQ